MPDDKKDISGSSTAGAPSAVPHGNGCGKFPSGDPEDDVIGWKDRVEQYFVAAGTPLDKQVATLIANIPGDTYKTLKKLAFPVLPSKKTLTELLQLLESHYLKKSNIRSERFKFHRAQQEVGESVSDFILRLRGLAETCEFGKFIPGVISNAGKLRESALEDSLCDRFVAGLRSEKIQQQLLASEKNTFPELCELALNLEMAFQEEKTIHGDNSVKKVSQKKNFNRREGKTTQKKQQNTQRSQSKAQSQKELCRRCGRKQHDPEDCPAKDWTCFSCNKKGHTSQVCTQSKKSGNSEKVKRILEVSGSVSPVATVSMSIEGQKIPMEIDTGAGPSLLSYQDFKAKFSHCKLLEYSVKLKSFTSDSIQVIGRTMVRVDFPTEQRVLELVIVQIKGNFASILGRDWLDHLTPGWRNKLVSGQTVSVVKNISAEITREFPHVTSLDANQMITGYRASVQVESRAPIFHRAYPVPLRLQDKVEAELNRLVDDKVLEKVDFSNWASPIVIAPKSNGDIRICIDAKATINPFMKVQQHPLPHIDEIFASLVNCNCFTVIDLSNAYLQLEVEEASKEFLTINTHRGLFRYNRLPFGVASAVAIFQSIIERILCGLEGVKAFLDDVIIGGRTMSECKDRVWEVLRRFNEHHVKINVNKSKFFQNSVEYLGHLLSENTVKPNPKKIEAIVSAPRPKNVKELQAFLGLINYYRNFIPDLKW